MRQNTSSFNKTIVEISKKLIDEIAEKIRVYNESFNKNEIVEYIDRKEEKEEDEKYRKLLDTWTHDKTDLDTESQGRLFYHLISVASMIRQSTGSRWMVFMIQDPEATDMIQNTKGIGNILTQKYKTYPFGMKADLRESWDNEIKKEDKITFTDILFGKNIVGNDIYSIRIGDVNEKKNRVDELIYIDIIGDFKDDSFEILDKRITMKYSPKKEDIIRILDEKLSDKAKVVNYINFMVKHTGFDPSKQRQLIIYAIPVLSTSLYPSCPSRSGLYIVSTKKIKYNKLLLAQNLISQLLCHIDYLRAAIIQRTEDIRLFTHDLRGAVGFNSREISNNRNVANNVRLNNQFMELLIDCLNGNKKTIEGYDLIAALLKENDWHIKLSEFACYLEPNWKSARITPDTKTNKTVSFPKIKSDSRVSGAFFTLLVVLLRNAWKHQFWHYNKNHETYKVNPFIRVDLMEDAHKYYIYIRNKKKRDEEYNNNENRILERKNLGRGTFAVIHKLENLINSDGNRAVFVADPFINNLKEDFITRICISKEVII